MLTLKRQPNVKTKTINIRPLNFYLQPYVSVETTLMTIDNGRHFNVDSKLIDITLYSDKASKNYMLCPGL